MTQPPSVLLVCQRTVELTDAVDIDDQAALVRIEHLVKYIRIGIVPILRSERISQSRTVRFSKNWMKLPMKSDIPLF